MPAPILPEAAPAADAPARADYRPALALLASLFFMWGFITVINNTLLPHLRSVFVLNYTQTTLIESVWFIAYFVASIPSAKLIERIGYGQTKRLAVVGGFVEAEEALSLGLVHEVTDDIDAAVDACVGKILRCAPGALAATKALLAEARLAPTGAMIGRAAEVFSQALTSAEGAEGTAAFLEKRKPAWAAKP